MGKWYQVEVTKTRSFMVEVEDDGDKSSAEDKLYDEIIIDDDETVEVFDVVEGERLRELLRETPSLHKLKL